MSESAWHESERLRARAGAVAAAADAGAGGRLTDSLCGTCKHAHIYRRRGGLTVIRCHGSCDGGALVVPPDIEACSKHEPLMAPDLDTLVSLALPIDTRELPPGAGW